MSINSKFIYAKTKSGFEEQIPNIPVGLNPIAFIEDTKEMWTCGTYFSVGYPSINVSETSGIVKVEIGNTNFTLETTGTGLTIRKGIANNIIINSDALTQIDTESPLSWNIVEKKLYHNESPTLTGNFGQSATVDNASIFHIPYITVDKYGHISAALNKTVSIRDYVEQLAPTSLNVDRNILLSYNATNANSDITQVRKANGLLFNDFSGVLTVSGGAIMNGDSEVTGDFTVKDGEIIGNLRGNVTGEATPKIHLSALPEYGGASKNLYGHVKVQDELLSEPTESSNNEDPASSSVTRGVAASPKMVWDVKQELSEDITTLDNKVDNKPNIGSFVAGQDTLIINQVNQSITIAGTNGINVSIEDGGFIIKGISITAYNNLNVETAVVDNINFSSDFVMDDDNKLWIKWEELPN